MTRQEILAVAKPILFNTDMVRAILDDRKTATRRVIKPRYRADESGFQVITTMKGEFVRVEKVDEDECGIFMDGTERYVNPPYKPGDYLYVRETWCALPVTSGGHMRGHDVYYYKADGDLRPDAWKRNWRPSIHMPKEAARIFLRVTAVRAERLREIKNFRAEGVASESCDECFIVCGGCDPDKSPTGCDNEAEAFANLWDSTIKPADLPVYGWEANPWVWVIEFERVTPEVH